MENILIKAAIGLFIIGALFGVLTLTSLNKKRRNFIVFLHGFFVSTALLLILITFFQNEPIFSILGLSFLFFILAALQGGLLFFLDKQKKPFPLVLLVFHPMFAAVGLILLIFHLIF